MKYVLMSCRTISGKLISVLSIVFIALLFIPSVQTYAGPIQTNVPHLKDVYANDFYIGCLLSYAHVGFSTDPPVPDQGTIVDTNGGYLVKYHMNSMSPGNWMKAQNTVNLPACSTAYAAATTQAEKDSIDIHPVIRFQGRMIAQFNWAQRQGFTFRGHTLIWYQQTPGTAFFYSGYKTSGSTRLSKTQMTLRMRFYIREIIRLIHESWPGLLSAMDVVNEAINDDGTDRSASNDWYTTFGDNSYIMEAFKWARYYTDSLGESQIKLYYNDYNTYIAAKANGIVRICGPLFRSGYLDGIGMQEHDANTSPTADQWIATYNKFDTLCTEMAVTEFDVNTNAGTNYPSAAILAQQANQYGQLFKCFVARSYKSGRGKIISVSKDGLRDSLTMVVNGASSLWNTQDQCKPAFYAAVHVGQYFNDLDSLIKYANTLNPANYNPASWSAFITALTSAQTAKNQNYSASISADSALGLADSLLVLSINNLTPNPNTPIYNITAHVINFGSVAQGVGKQDSLRISNTGTDTLWITSVTSSNALFTFAPSTFNIAPAGNKYLVVTFTPTDTSSQLGYIAVIHNAAGSPDTITVDGKGLGPISVPISQQPTVFALSQNYPNPFNPTTQIDYSVPQNSYITLKVYDLLGKEVATLVEGNKQAGNYTATFNANRLASGIYFYRLQASSNGTSQGKASNFVETRKLVLLK